MQVDVNNASSTYGTIVDQGQFNFTAQGGTANNEPLYFFADWAYVPYAGNDYLWGVGIDNNNGTANYAYLYRFTKSTRTFQIVYNYGDLGIRNTASNGNRVNFGAVYASPDGYLYGAENLSGRTYRFTVTPPYGAEYLGVGSTTLQNDGARCIDNTEPIGNY